MSTQPYPILLFVPNPSRFISSSLIIIVTCTQTVIYNLLSVLSATCMYMCFGLTI